MGLRRCAHHGRKAHGGGNGEVPGVLRQLGVDRPDFQFVVAEACQGMVVVPGESGMKRVKRIAHYIQAIPKVVITYGGESEVENAFSACVDSDWGGCRPCRKSTSGGVLTVGGMAVKTWSSAQSSVATGSGEAEYYALTRGAAESLGLAATIWYF